MVSTGKSGGTFDGGVSKRKTSSVHFQWFCGARCLGLSFVEVCAQDIKPVDNDMISRALWSKFNFQKKGFEIFFRGECPACRFPCNCRRTLRWDEPTNVYVVIRAVVVLNQDLGIEWPGIGDREYLISPSESELQTNGLLGLHLDIFKGHKNCRLTRSPSSATAGEVRVCRC